MSIRSIVPKTRIVLALDCETEEECVRVLNSCYEQIDLIKVNYPLILSEGLPIIGRLKKVFGKPIIADFKVADAPVTNNRIVKLVKDAGADSIMVHAIVGTDAIYEIKQIGGGELEIIVVTELTHPGGLEFTRKYAEEAAKLALEMGCLGIQAPGTRPEQIEKLRQIVGQDMIIVACGVGAQGGQYSEVIKAGADYAIIGRAIYESSNPSLAIESIIT
ncbi:MAG: orotidine-5'-phosphate decarboxylase [Flavobacteriales bacterium]|nr:orotidine-5'-phosphate decarboxylase [Flavobacteriales bacterium]